jgi:hypothetical protein
MEATGQWGELAGGTTVAEAGHSSTAFSGPLVPGDRPNRVDVDVRGPTSEGVPGVQQAPFSRDARVQVRL